MSSEMQVDNPPAFVGTGSTMRPEPMTTVGVVDVVGWVSTRRRAIGIATIGVACAAIAVALVMPNVYTARSTLLPPNGAPGSSSAAALAALGSLGGLSGGLGAKTPDELYVALLRSDSVLRALDEAHGLRDRVDVKTYEELRTRLPTFVRVSSDRKSGVITVEVDDKDPTFAAMLANAFPTELMRVLSRLAVTDAQQRRQFFENQLRQVRDNLVQAEESLRRLQESSGVVVLERQAEALIEGAATIRARIAEREVQLRVLRASATPRNPDVLRLTEEVGALRAELARMESRQGGTAGSAVDLPVGKLPQASLDYIRARRDLKLQEALLESMLRQYEAAKVDEAKEGPALQIVDRALPPDRKSKPKRLSIVVGTTVAGFLLAVLVAIALGLRMHLRTHSRRPVA